MAGQTGTGGKSFIYYTDGTNIDRECCTRVVPMKVLALGLCRTGTLSLRAALKQLGYIDTYHMRSASTETPRDNEMWLRALDAKFDGVGEFGKGDWDKLLGHCQAVTDFPAAAFGPELIAAYPDAKVILTLRDADSWHYSTTNTIWKIIEDTTFSWLAWLDPSLRNYRRMLCMLFDRFFDGDFPGKGKEIFNRHYQEIRDIVPEHNLLEFRVEDGWGPLCTFLGEKIPDRPFPSGNTVGEFVAGAATRNRHSLGRTLRRSFIPVTIVALLGVSYLRFFSESR